MLHAKRYKRAYLERNVVISNTNLQLLLPDDVLLGPFCVIFSKIKHQLFGPSTLHISKSLDNFTGLYDALELLDH